MPDWGLARGSKDRPLTGNEMPVDISVNRNITILYCVPCVKAVWAFFGEANDQIVNVNYKKDCLPFYCITSDNLY